MGISVGASRPHIKDLYKKGDILVHERYRDGELPGKYFTCTLVDDNWGVVGYEWGKWKDTIGVAYVHKANFFQRIYYHLIYKRKNLG